MNARDNSQEAADAVEMGEVHSVSTHQTNEFTKGDYAGAVAKTDPEEIRLVRKLDTWIMVSDHGPPQCPSPVSLTEALSQPILFVMYFLNYVDRGSLAQARLNHLERDLDMHGENFNVAVSSFSVGYILMQIPSNMLITRVRPSAYLSVIMFIWSVLSACTGLVHSFEGLIACRILLGLFEAPPQKAKLTPIAVLARSYLPPCNVVYQER
ncbi:E3 ubiquitin ligase complex SCF subunit scon-3 [Apiospora arundinis]|uniref:Major facilitator superfamily domain-containing protein n=1 Tax=Apiospora arundinis TaxID=335852 RepID=A0ABR2I559_9PEZI